MIPVCICLKCLSAAVVAACKRLYRAPSTCHGHSRPPQPQPPPPQQALESHQPCWRSCPLTHKARFQKILVVPQAGEDGRQPHASGVSLHETLCSHSRSKPGILPVHASYVRNVRNHCPAFQVSDLKLPNLSQTWASDTVWRQFDGEKLLCVILIIIPLHTLGELWREYPHAESFTSHVNIYILSILIYISR